VLLRGVKREEVERGQVFIEAGVDHAASEIQGGDVYLDEGGGGSAYAFFNGYRPQFYFRTTDVTGVATLPEGVEMGDAGGQCGVDGGVDHPDCDGEGVAVCHPGGGANRGGRCHQ